MKIFRSLGYFLRLRELFGFWGAIRFAFAYAANLLRDAELYRVPVGERIFYYPSAANFASLFVEIFFNGAYYLPKTDAPIRAIDGGAHIGVSLLYIKLRAPRARVLCFEPNPASRRVLEKNIEANGWRGEVEVLPYALGEAAGSADLFVDTAASTTTSASLTRSFKPKLGAQASHHVEVVALSPYIDEPVDFLKLDIEGGERGVIAELIKSGKLASVAALEFEYHYNPRLEVPPPSHMLQILEEQGFKTFIAPAGVSIHDVFGKTMEHNYMLYAWRHDGAIPG